MLLATTVELFDGLVARGIPGQGRLAEIADSARYDAMHAPHRRARRRRRARGPGRRADRRPGRAPGSYCVDEQSEAGGALLGSTDTHRRRPALEWVADAVAELADLPRRAAPAAHHRVRALRRRVRARAASGAPTTSAATAPAQLSAASGCGASGPATSSSRRARTSARSCSPTTTGPASCSPHGARTFLHRYGVMVGRAGRRVHHQRQRLRRRVRPARRRRADQRRRRRPRPRRRRACGDECDDARHPGARRARWSPAPAATSASPHATRRRAPPATTSAPPWRIVRRAAGQRRLEPGGAPVQPGPRPAALRRRRSAPSCPASSSTASSVAGAANGVFDLAGCLRDGPRGRGRGARELGFDAGDRAAGDADVRRAERRAAGAVAGARPATRRPAVRRRAARRHGRRHRPRRRRRACARSSTSSATPPSAPRTTRARPPASIASGITAELLGVPVEDVGHHHVPAALHPGRVRRAGRPRAAGACSTPSASPRCTTGTSRAARCSRTSGSGSARGTTRSPARTWTTAVLRECAADAHRRRHPRRLHARQDRRAGPRRRRAARPALHEPDEQPEGRHRSATA